jgi:hypothetical protein
VSEWSEIGSEQLDALDAAFRAMLIPCLEECALGRWGLFGQNDHGGETARHQPWPEADRCRELALTVQATLAQSGERNALCDEFLDLCTIHGENDPGEPRLSRMFLKRIEAGEVGTSPAPEKQTPEKKKW